MPHDIEKICVIPWLCGIQWSREKKVSCCYSNGVRPVQRVAKPINTLQQRWFLQGFNAEIHNIFTSPLVLSETKLLSNSLIDLPCNLSQDQMFTWPALPSSYFIIFFSPATATWQRPTPPEWGRHSDLQSATDPCPLSWPDEAQMFEGQNSEASRRHC